jgi:hypothetical protein
VCKRAASTGAAIDERVRTLRIVGVQPAHHGLRVAPRAGGHLRGTAATSDVIEGEIALAAARMGRPHGQMAQILWRLIPTRKINM